MKVYIIIISVRRFLFLANELSPGKWLLYLYTLKSRLKISPQFSHKFPDGAVFSLNNCDTDVVIIRPQRTGSASVSETVINIAKTCMGTGTLALPYAARQGGLLLHVLGLIAIGAWNLYSVERLLHCLELMPVNKDHHWPPEGTAMLGKVALHTLGRTRLYALDVIIVLSLSGIVEVSAVGKSKWSKWVPLKLRFTVDSLPCPCDNAYSSPDDGDHP